MNEGREGGRLVVFLALATGAVQCCSERLPSTGAEKVFVLKV